MRGDWDANNNPSESSISEICQECIQSLQACLDLPLLMQYEWSENRLAEFKLWAGGIGAFAGERASLDARLAADRETKTLVKNILILLQGCIEKCRVAGSSSSFETGAHDGAEDDSRSSSDDPNELSAPPNPIPRSFSPWSDLSTTTSESSDGLDYSVTRVDALDAAKHEVEQVIDHLTRLGFAIRKSGITSRSQKADRLFEFEDHHDLFRYLTVLILGRGSEEGREHYNVDPKTLSPIQERLAVANLRRRHRFLYAQKHAQKLASVTVTSNTESQFDIPIFDNPVLIEENASQELRWYIRVHPLASRVYDISDALAVVRPFQLCFARVPNGSEFVPILFVPILKHLMEDICPYTCVIEGCPKPDVLYINRIDLTQHITDDHPRCWECLPCTTPGYVPLLFPSVEEFLSHTQQVHGTAITEDQYSPLVTAAARPAPAGISQCPLCDQTGTADSEDLLDHISEHVHSFSLSSLPWPKDEMEEDENAPEDYFKNNDYFEQDFDDRSDQYNLSSDSDRDSVGLASLPSYYSLSCPPSEDIPITVSQEQVGRTQPETSAAAIERFQRMSRDANNIMPSVPIRGTRCRSLPDLVDRNDRNDQRYEWWPEKALEALERRE
ncbi:hypothetical protein FSARC_12035 [Fusarium sarcochroum]|uniref:C2H2-type domain-containing protein n=1 Tax=Fusarium sarcochroum TaxID=1208366 RepID=A0A8H4TB34_9HYPO|nr:hypothetical protein FSARC_12035 [Fusarium sarcochroum]